jgi:hypothetical protein
MKYQKTFYVKKKWLSGPHSVNDSGLEKGDNMGTISLIFGSTFVTILHALG